MPQALTRPRTEPPLPAAAPPSEATRRGLWPAPAEAFSCGSHLAGAVAAVIGTLVLALLARTPLTRGAALTYGVGMIFMFGASALYHARKDEEGGASLWRRLDHLAIFFMIAGSYTPICVVHLEGAWRAAILGVVWGLVLAGTFFKLFVIRAPRWLTAGIYVAMGWIAVVPLHRLLASMDSTTGALLVAGGITYTLGAVAYATRRPDPWPGRFGFHEVFHVFVLAAAALHYAAIYRVVT